MLLASTGLVCSGDRGGSSSFSCFRRFARLCDLAVTRAACFDLFSSRRGRVKLLRCSETMMWRFLAISRYHLYRSLIRFHRRTVLSYFLDEIFLRRLIATGGGEGFHPRALVGQQTRAYPLWGSESYYYSSNRINDGLECGIFFLRFARVVFFFCCAEGHMVHDVPPASCARP